MNMLNVERLDVANMVSGTADRLQRLDLVGTNFTAVSTGENR